MANRQIRASIILTIAAIFVFWTVRLAYWSSIYEVPFSDMNDLLNTARQVLCCWDFGHSPFWQSYSKPTLPLFGAATLALFGENLLAWRFVMGSLCCSALAWMSFEIWHGYRQKFLAIAIIWVVALSKSSVFWSYKFATEGLSEAFTYLVIAQTLYVVRLRNSGKSWWVLGVAALFLGITLVLAMLNRPNALIGVIAAPLIILMFPLSQGSSGVKHSRRMVACFICVCGIALAWTPWLYRSYKLYGHVVPLTTQGVYSFMWELGQVTIYRPNGSAIHSSAHELQMTAPVRFKNDYRAYRYASKFVRTWLEEHGTKEYPLMVWNRLKRTVTERPIALTKVPRDQILPGFWNDILLDKNVPVCIIGSLGVLLLPLYGGALAIFPFVVLGQWFVSILFLGEARMLEPTLPLVIFGNVVAVYTIYTFAMNRVSKVRGVSPSNAVALET